MSHKTRTWVRLEDEHRFQAWIGPSLEVFGNPNATPEQQKAADEASAQLSAYLMDIVRSRHADPRDDMIPAMVHEDTDGSFSDLEVVKATVLLFIAGHVTTVNATASTILALLRTPEALRQVRDDPTLVAGAFEEGLRMGGPVQYILRVALADIPVGDAVIPADADVRLHLAAADRDPRRFPDPDTFDPQRRDNQHLGFNGGPHFCFGAPLARMEARVMLTEWLRRVENPRLVVDPPPYRTSPGFVGPQELMVDFDGVRDRPGAAGRRDTGRDGVGPGRTPAMRCAAIHAAGDVRVDERPDPVAGDDESLVRITSVGLCGSDLHWFAEGAIGDAVLGDPLVLGHEMAGVVLSGPLAGRTVGLDPALPCRQCRECRAGLEHLCARMRFAGHGVTDGGLRELVAWPDRHLHVLPDGYDPACGSLLEPLGVAVHSTDLAHLRPGWTVAVVGCGPIGLMLVELAAAAGCEVVAVEPRAHRREAARRAGAVQVLAPDDVTRDAPTEGTCHVAFEVSGADDGLERSALLARPGGRIVLVGIPDDDATTFRASLMRRKGLTLACARRMTENAYQRAISLAVRGVVDLSWLTSHRFALEDATEAFATAARREGLKVVVDVTT